MVWRSCAQALSQQARLVSPFGGHFGNMTSVCSVGHCFLITLLFLRVVVGRVATRSCAGVPKGLDWPLSWAVVSYRRVSLCVWEVEQEGLAHLAPEGEPFRPLRVSRVSSVWTASCCGGGVRRTDFGPVYCRVHLGCISSLIRRAGCTLDGKGLGSTTNRCSFESQLNNSLDGWPWEII